MTQDVAVQRWADGRGIEVTGRGVVSGSPDVVRVRMAASALRPTVAEAVADADAAVRRIREALAGRGVTGRDAATAGLTVAAEQAWDQTSGTARSVGYRSRHDLAVTVRDLAGFGLVLGEALAAGADAAVLDAVTFEVEDPTPLQVRARERAWQDALARAEQLAALAGAGLGPLLDLVEAPASVGVPIGMVTTAAAKLDAVELAVEPGSVQVDVVLAVRWAVV